MQSDFLNDNRLLNNSFIYDTIMKDYPLLGKCGKPVFIANAYYPIALLEFDMDEFIFEDFQPIERVILQCFQNDITSAYDISNLIGLPIRYVKNHIIDLENKNQIINGSLTEFGLRSLQENQLVQKLNNNKQMFQTDAVFGNLLPHAFFQPAVNRRIPQVTNKYLLHIKHSEEIDSDKLCEKLMGENLINKYRRKILHTNVSSINSIILSDMFYVPIIILWMEIWKTPVLFFKTHEKTISGKNTAFTKKYKPLYIQENLQHFIPCEESIIINEKSLLDLCGSWLNYINGCIPSEKSIRDLFDKKPFDVEKYFLQAHDNGITTCHVHLKGGTGILTPNDLRFLSVAGNNSYPMTMFQKSSYNRPGVISFTVEIDDPILDYFTTQLRNRWKMEHEKFIDFCKNSIKLQQELPLEEGLKYLLEQEMNNYEN